MLRERIEAGLAKSRTPREWSGVWNATDCVGCPRALLHIARKCLSVRGSIPVSSIYKMEDGILHEDDIIARLRLSGVKGAKPGAIMAPDIPVVIHPDWLFAMDGVQHGLEIKSYGCDYFHPLTVKGVKEQSPGYYRQMQFYMHYTGIKQWVLLAKDRDCCELHEEIVRYDPECVSGLIDTVLSAKAVIEQGLDCEALPCSSDFMTRLFCPFNMLICEGPTEEIFLPEATKAGESWLWAKKISEQTGQEISSARVMLRDILAASGNRRMDVTVPFVGSMTRLRVYASGQKRHVPDMDLARKILSQDFDLVFPLKEIEGPRIFRLGDNEDAVSD